MVPVSDEGLEVLLGLGDPGHSVCDDHDDVGNEGDEGDGGTKNTGGKSDGGCEVPFSSDRLDDVISSLSAAVPTIHVPPPVLTHLIDLRTYLREELSVEVSDRRLVKAVRLLRIVSASDGRGRGDLVDCLLLQHVVWSSLEQRGAVRDWLWDRLGSAVGDGGGGGGGGGGATGEAERF